MSGIIIKFGGTSLGDASRIRRAAQATAAAAASHPVIVVVSAMAGVTRRLRGIVALSRPSPQLAASELDSILDEHRDIAAALQVDVSIDSVVPAIVGAPGHALIAHVGNGDPAAADTLLASGERLSTALLQAALAALGHTANVVPSEQLIVTDDRHGQAQVDAFATRTAITSRRERFDATAISIVPGFSGATAAGITTTLGSNSSDYSAALIAAALGWPLQIWTDVAGCYDADPRQVPGARLLPSLSLIDADRYARAGASVIHARTLQPLLDTPVPVTIVNSFAADVSGTRIGDGDAEPLHGIAVRDDLHLLASDEGDRGDAISPLALAEEATPFTRRVAIISIFDDAQNDDLLDRCNAVLTAAQQLCLAAWWSSGDACVCIAVDPTHAIATARALHAALFGNSHCVTMPIAIIGAGGRVARRLIALLGSRHRELQRSGIALRVIAVADSRRACIDIDGIEPSTVSSRLADAPPSPLANLSHDLLALPQRPLLVLDCTASADVAACYPAWLAAGIDVVTPNKHGPAADAALSRAIATAQTQSGARFVHETTVGAQLPLLRTLRELTAAGDRVVSLEAVLSGTLSFVLNRVQAGQSFSASVRESIALGYAEPHPAADLSGADAARKLVILLRALGIRIDVADVQVVAPVGLDLLGEPDPSRLLDALDSVDAAWKEAATTAAADGEVWIYRASYRDGIARVAPERIANDQLLARLAPCENALRLQTRYYRDAPLTIAGPGAGIDLTAAGLYADLLGVIERYRPQRNEHDTTAAIIAREAVERRHAA